MCIWPFVLKLTWWAATSAPQSVLEQRRKQACEGYSGWLTVCLQFNLFIYEPPMCLAVLLDLWMGLCWLFPDHSLWLRPEIHLLFNPRIHADNQMRRVRNRSQTCRVQCVYYTCYWSFPLECNTDTMELPDLHSVNLFWEQKKRSRCHRSCYVRP